VPISKTIKIVSKVIKTTIYLKRVDILPINVYNVYTH